MWIISFRFTRINKYVKYSLLLFLVRFIDFFPNIHSSEFCLRHQNQSKTNISRLLNKWYFCPIKVKPHQKHILQRKTVFLHVIHKCSDNKFLWNIVCSRVSNTWFVLSKNFNYLEVHVEILYMCMSYVLPHKK